jgi:multiple sugar transport system permease protein
MSIQKKLAEIIRDPVAWVNSPSFDNTKQKWGNKVKDFIFGICMAIIIVGVCYIILSPIFGIISSAIMTWEDAINPLVFLIPQNVTFDNISFAFKYMDYVPTLARTLGFAIGFALLQVAVCSMVGYGFARFKFTGSEVLFALVIITIVVPVHSYMVPTFLNFRFFLEPVTNLINSVFGTEMQWNLIYTRDSTVPWALILLTLTGVGIRSGLYIYIFRQFFRGLPKEIEEAAFIDGAGPFYTYIRVMMPNAVPAIVTVLLFAFVWHYNDTFYTARLMNDFESLAKALGHLNQLYSVGENDYNPLSIQMVVVSGVLLVVAPILIIYLFLQRYFVEGLERSGIVG